MFFCKKCGAQLEDGADFCNACGATIEKETESKNGNKSFQSSSSSLMRTDDGKILAGICAGMSKKWNCNPWIFRVLFIVFSSWSIFLYIALIFILKKEN